MPFCAHLHAKLRKSSYKSKKIFQIQKSNMGIKNAEFNTNFKTVEKVFKKIHQSYWQKRDGNMHFFHFYSCSSNLFSL